MIFPTHPSSAVPLAAVLIAACAESTRVPDPGPAAALLGEWTHAQALHARSDPPPDLNAGLLVAIAIDSARGMQFWGHVTLWFAGDVGVPTSQFGPVRGRIETSGVILRVERKSMAELRIEGTIDGDILTVRASWRGDEPGPFSEGCRFQRLH